MSSALDKARDEFLAQWGSLGSAWGVPRTMSRIHALLMVSPEPLSTDGIMAELEISRGNTHTNVKELVRWGLVRSVVRKGERKELFEAEKDVWRVVQLITEERRRREVEPVLAALDGCLERTRGERGADIRAFRAQIKELRKFTEIADGVARRLSKLPSPSILGWVGRFLK